MVIGDPVTEDNQVVSGNIIARNDLPKTTFSKSQEMRKDAQPSLSFFRNSAAMRFELPNNKQSVMLVMRGATGEKNDKGKPVYDNQNRIVMSLKQQDLGPIIYFLKYAPDIENIQPVKLYHDHSNGSKNLLIKYNAENGGFSFNLDSKSKEGQVNKAWIILNSQEVLCIEILLTYLFPIILGF